MYVRIQVNQNLKSLKQVILTATRNYKGFWASLAPGVCLAPPLLHLFVYFGNPSYEFLALNVISKSQTSSKNSRRCCFYGQDQCIA